jgi:membrane-associated protein
VINFKSAAARRTAIALVVIFTLPTFWFALRSYGSFELLRSAYQAGAPQTGNIRGWMTLSYVARAYHIEPAALISGLGLAPDTDPNTDLRAVAAQSKTTTFEYVERVQRAVAALIGKGVGNGTPQSSGWLAALADGMLSAMLVYGYPILALIQLSGAIGAPVPDGIAGAVAGSLVAQGRMNLAAASSVIVIASVVGDIVGYGVGRVISRDVLERHGHWIGYTPARSIRIKELFSHWGLLTVLITRTFVSYLSSAANLMAGVSRYHFLKFVAIAFLGRVIWTAAYLGLGYVIGSDFEAATGFLGNLSGFLLFGTALVIATWFAIAGVGSPRQTNSRAVLDR